MTLMLLRMDVSGGFCLNFHWVIDPGPDLRYTCSLTGRFALREPTTGNALSEAQLSDSTA